VCDGGVCVGGEGGCDGGGGGGGGGVGRGMVEKKCVRMRVCMR